MNHHLKGARRLDGLDQSMTGDPHELVATFLRGQARAVAARHGLAEGTLAEEYRLVRFGALEELFQRMAVPIPGAPAAPVREGLDPQSDDSARGDRSSGAAGAAALRRSSSS